MDFQRLLLLVSGIVCWESSPTAAKIAKTLQVMGWRNRFSTVISTRPEMPGRRSPQETIQKKTSWNHPSNTLIHYFLGGNPSNLPSNQLAGPGNEKKMGRIWISVLANPEGGPKPLLTKLSCWKFGNHHGSHVVRLSALGNWRYPLRSHQTPTTTYCWWKTSCTTWDL